MQSESLESVYLTCSSSSENTFSQISVSNDVLNQCSELAFQNSNSFINEKSKYIPVIDNQEVFMSSELSNHSSYSECIRQSDLYSPDTQSLKVDSDCKKLSQDSVPPRESAPLTFSSSESFYNSCPSSNSEKTKKFEILLPLTNSEVATQNSLEKVADEEYFSAMGEQRRSIPAELSNHSSYNESIKLCELCLPQTKSLIDSDWKRVSLDSATPRESMNFGLNSSEFLYNSCSSIDSGKTEKLIASSELTTQYSSEKPAENEYFCPMGEQRKLIAAESSNHSSYNECLKLYDLCLPHIKSVDSEWEKESLDSIFPRESVSLWSLAPNSSESLYSSCSSPESEKSERHKKIFSFISSEIITQDNSENATDTEKNASTDGKKWFVEFGNNKNYIKSLSINYDYRIKWKWLPSCFDISDAHSEETPKGERWIINYDNLNYIKSQLSPADFRKYIL